MLFDLSRLRQEIDSAFAFVHLPFKRPYKGIHAQTLLLIMDSILVNRRIAKGILPRKAKMWPICLTL